MAETANWYVVHTYSGYENTVKATIEKYVENRNLQDLILRICIPTEKVEEPVKSSDVVADKAVKEGEDKPETKIVERKVFPGYVLIKMVLNDDTWHVVRNIRGVTGFLGDGDKAIPLPEREVVALGIDLDEDEDTIEIIGASAMESDARSYAEKLGNYVRIISGAMEGHEAAVKHVDAEAHTVDVTIDMFGREIDVTLDFDQVEPADAE